MIRTMRKLWEIFTSIHFRHQPSLVQIKHAKIGEYRFSAFPESAAQLLNKKIASQDHADMVEGGLQKLSGDFFISRDNSTTERSPKFSEVVDADTWDTLWDHFCPELLPSDESNPAPTWDGRTYSTKIEGSRFWRGRTFHAAGRAGNAIYKTLPQQNEFFWTKLISAHTKCGQGREALRLYKKMREEGVRPKSYTFVAALKACSSIADLQAGREIHAHVIQNGNESDIFVASTLVSMYAKCGSMADALQVFKRMENRDVVVWTTMIMGYAEKEGESALQLYAHMQHEGLTPDSRTFVAALKACSCLAAQEDGKQVNGQFVKLRCLEKGKAIHSELAKSGFQSDIFVATSLVDMYAKCGSMVDARMVFDGMLHHDLVAWTAMIMGYAQIGKGELALQLYEGMQREGLKPDDRTFVAALKSCSSLAEQEEGKQSDSELVKIRCLEKGRAVHSQIAKSGFESDGYVANSLLDMYVKCGSMVDARKVFERMTCRDLVSWNSMLLGYVQREEGELALQLYARMQYEGFTPDAYTFVAALMACGSLAVQGGNQVDDKVMKIAGLERGRAIHFEAVQGGSESDVFVGSALVAMYVKCGSMADARWVFEKMIQRDLVSWNAMIMGYAQRDEADLALQLYARMQQEGFTPDAYTFAAALMACGKLTSVEVGKEIHAEIYKVGLEGDAYLVTCLVDMYGKCGCMVDAQWLFDASPVRDIVRWSALIAGYSGQGDSNCVFDLFEKMQQDGIQPASITFVSVLTACSHAGLVDKGQGYFGAMCSDYAVTPANEHYNCMVDLLARAGQLDEAVAMVKKMPFKLDIVTYMTMLSACRKWNNVETGKHFFECAVKLDEKQPAPYVLMTNIYASANMREECAKVQARRTNAQA